MTPKKTITREHLSKVLLAHNPSLNLNDTRKYVDTIVDSIANALKSEKVAKIRSLGTFSVYGKKKRIVL